MADYKVDSIADVKVADDPSSVRVAVVAGAEQLVLTIDWRKASDLIDRMAAVNHEIRHSLSVPDWRAATGPASASPPFCFFRFSTGSGCG